MPKNKRVVLPEPHPTPWMHYALRALHQWFEQDEPGSQALWAGDTDRVRKWMGFYGIARNYPGLQSHIVHLAKVVRTSGNRIQENEGSDVVLVRAVQKVSIAVDKRPRVSAASKLLYLAQPKYGVIYDSHACAALDLPPNVEYSCFLQHWNSAFTAKRSQIRERLAAAAGLPDQAFPLGLANAKRCRSLLKQRWFARRVFDIYLWHEGERLLG